jgi:hypothetical protein
LHEAFSVYGQGVGLATARLPAGWRDRLIEVRGENTCGVSGLCLEPHDLLIAKYRAGRGKDAVCCKAVVAAGPVSAGALLDRLAATPAGPEDAARVRRDFRGRRPAGRTRT